ncbi:uncharacterized protein LOC114520149 [Dendronephthya gigantea]|uniref:uncharacterized protein LOC114520149 n=1 Tax=Dendronephthya gigantea TaxID=151771 RepID=UPI00106BDFFB|nr:uncharacterized protein LOC114520149 [Dendronephthya gigantea]
MRANPESILLLFLVLKISHPGDCSINELLFRKVAKRYLANHVIDTKLAGSEHECGLYCVRDGSCTSANYKTSGTGKGRCELNDKTLQETSENDKKTNPEFNHLYLVMPRMEVHPSEPTCWNANWWSSFDKAGLSKCSEENHFIAGFYRNSPNVANSDPIYLLESAKCCVPNEAFSAQSSVCKTASWWTSFDRNDNWNLCPVGYFLNGLGRSVAHYLYNIEYGHCCKPNNHPDHYGPCYDEDVGTSFDKKGWSICSKAGFYIVGLYRGSGGNWLNNIEKFRCCKMIE